MRRASAKTSTQPELSRWVPKRSRWAGADWRALSATRILIRMPRGSHTANQTAPTGLLGGVVCYRRRHARHPLRCIEILLFLSGFFVSEATTSAEVGNRHSTYNALTGTCTKVMVMDQLIDPGLCSDQVTAIKLSGGGIGYTFTVDAQGNQKLWVMSFFGSNPKHTSENGGADSSSIYRIYLTADDSTNDLVALGSCVLSNANVEVPAKLSCSAVTTKGSFVGEFVADKRSD